MELFQAVSCRSAFLLGATSFFRVVKVRYFVLFYVLQVVLGCFGSCFSSVCVDFPFFSIFYCVLGLFSAVVCSLHFSHCCCKLSPVGSVCFRLLSFLVTGAFLSFVVFVVSGCSSLFF